MALDACKEGEAYIHSLHVHTFTRSHVHTPTTKEV